MRVAVIGLGNIGGGVAGNLAEAGHDVHVADLDEGRVAAMVARGATAADDAVAAVHEAEFVFTSLPGPTQIRGVADDILDAMPPGTVWLELSTNDTTTFHELRERAAAVDVEMIDAPVSGGPEGAQAGTLSIFVGATSEKAATIEPLLNDIGTAIYFLGPPGAGIATKIAQVTLCYTQTVTLIESMILGAKAGVDPTTMLDVITNSAGTSYSAEAYGPEILAGTYDASFPLSHAAKDLRLAMDLAADVGAELPFTSTVAELYAQAVETYGPTAAHCLAAQLIEQRNNTILSDTVSSEGAPR